MTPIGMIVGAGTYKEVTEPVAAAGTTVAAQG
jgi:hypothetical protein